MEVVRKPLIGSEITFNGVRCIATHTRCRWMLIFNNKRTMDSYAAATVNSYTNNNKLCGRPPQYVPATCKLTFDLESDVRLLCDVGSPSVPILVFLVLFVLDLGLMYATDRRQTRVIA